MRLKNMRLMVVAVLALAALALSACAGGVAAVAAPAQQADGGDMQNVIVVSGHGEASGAPDMGTVQLGIESMGDDLDAALTEANDTIAAVRDAVIAEGVAENDIQTVNFNVWVEQPRNDQGRPTGDAIYHVNNMLNVKVREIDNVGSVLEAGLNAGANNVNGLGFSIEDTSALESEARTGAVADARARAEELAAALGVELGDPVYISESFGGVPPQPLVRGIEMAADMGMGGGAPPISEGELTVSVNVTVSFLMEQ